MALKNDLYINVEPYTEILGGLSFVLSISNGIVKLTGKTGSGKTAMCIELLQELRTEKLNLFISSMRLKTLPKFRRLSKKS